MYNVIEFLERVGSDSRLRHASAAEQAAAMAQIDPALREALAARDSKRLEQLLGARSNVICGMAPAEDDAPSRKKDEEEEIRSGFDQRARTAA
jgi:hypothetical protein